MKISKNSWHYRLWRYSGLYPSTLSLCPYFWITVLLSISTFIWVPHVLLAKSKRLEDHFFTRLSLHILITLGYLSMALGAYNDPYIALAVYGSLGTMAFVSIGCFMLSEYIKNWKTERREKRIAELRARDWKEKEKPPNLLLETIKAKKEKYCPKLEFVDDK